MNRCVICKSPKIKTFWSGRGGNKLHCSFRCYAINSPTETFFLTIFLSALSIIIILSDTFVEIKIFILVMTVPSAFLFAYGFWIGSKNQDIKRKADMERLYGKEKSDYENDNSIYIKELDKSYRGCCYQTARLGDKYCVCGRVSDKKLVNYLEMEN